MAWNPNSAASNVQSVRHLSYPHLVRKLPLYLCPVRLPFVLPLSCQNTFSGHVHVKKILYLYSRNANSTPLVQHLYCPSLVSTPYLLHHAQSVCHFTCSCQVGTLSLLMLNLDNLFYHVQSEYYLSAHAQSVIPSPPIFSLNTTSTAHVQSEQHLSCPHSVSSLPLLPCPLRIHTLPGHVQSPLLPKFNQYTISPAHFQ